MTGCSAGNKFTDVLMAEGWSTKERSEPLDTDKTTSSICLEYKCTPPKELYWIPVSFRVLPC